MALALALALPMAAPAAGAQGGVVEKLHSITVADPFRWLESTDDPEVQAWAARQNAEARQHLDALPMREAFAERLTALWNHERYGLPRPGRQGQLLYERNDGLQEQPVLYIQAEPEAEPRVLVDPNRMTSEAGREPVSLADYALSPDGRWLAYAVSRSGSDWNRLRVRELASGKDRPEVIRRVKFSSIAWTADSRGFFYSRYPDAPATAAGDADSAPDFDPLAHQQLRYHRLGTAPEDDPVIRHDPEHPQRGYGARVSEDGRWLFISIWEGTRHNLLEVVDLGAGSKPELDAPARPIVSEFRADFTVIGSRGNTAFVLTDDGAPNGRIIAVNLRRPEAPWTTLVAESRDVLRDAVHAGNRLVVHALRDVASVLLSFDEQGGDRRELPLPGLGGVRGISGRRDLDRLYFAFGSTVQPTANYRIRPDGQGPRQLLHAPDIDFARADYGSLRGFATSRDAERIPVFVSQRRDLPDDRPAPTLLYVYGGFNIALQPRFSVPVAAWLEAGGRWAVVHARGGGEYGRAWHEAGIRANKPTTIDDVIAAAGWLTHQGLTTPQQLALHGASNGGMVVGATVNRRPDLFAAAVPAVGVMDLLRFHRFTIGWAWKPDYGDPEDPEDFRTLLRLSPYHNLRPDTAYPATLVVTADTDDRVAPAHSFKYAARLQQVQAGDAPVLLRVQVKAGHGAGKGTSVRIDEWADILAFVHAHTARRKAGQDSQEPVRKK